MHCPRRTKPGMGDQLQHYVRLLWPNKWWNKHLITMHLQPSLATARVLSFVLCGLSDVGRGGTVEDCLNIFNRSLYSWWLGRGGAMMMMMMVSWLLVQVLVRASICHLAVTTDRAPCPCWMWVRWTVWTGSAGLLIPGQGSYSLSELWHWYNTPGLPTLGSLLWEFRVENPSSSFQSIDSPNWRWTRDQLSNINISEQTNRNKLNHAPSLSLASAWPSVILENGEGDSLQWGCVAI